MHLFGLHFDFHQKYILSTNLKLATAKNHYPFDFIDHFKTPREIHLDHSNHNDFEEKGYFSFVLKSTPEDKTQRRIIIQLIQ